MKIFLTPIIAATLIIGSFTVKGQTTDSTHVHHWKRHPIYGAFQIQAMYRKSNLGQLNQILNNNGLPPLSENAFWLNLSGMHIHKQSIIEDGIGFAFTRSSEMNHVDAKYNEFQLYWRYGYNVTKSTSYRLFPFAGINLSDAMIRMHNHRDQTQNTDFSQSLLMSSPSRTFNQGRFGFDLGAGFDFIIKASPKQYDNFTLERNIPVGVRIGYFVQVTDRDWHVDGYSLTNGPDNKQSNVFVSVNIGLGYGIVPHSR